MITDKSRIRSIDSLFGKARQGILALLLLNFDRSFYLREIVRITMLGMGPVQRELENLVNAGIITRTRRGNQVYYQANDRSPIFSELKSIITKTVGVADVLRSSLGVLLADKIKLAFIYGSFAKGTSRSESDVDLMVVGDASLLEVVSALKESKMVLNREINPSVFSPEEFARKINSGHSFISRVWDGPKIWLTGSEDDFENLGR